MICFHPGDAVGDFIGRVPAEESVGQVCLCPVDLRVSAGGRSRLSELCRRADGGG